MKSFLLMLLGKETSRSIDDLTDNVFRSECYYDWIGLNVIGNPENSLKDNPESLLVKSYDEEMKLRQKMIENGLHVQQGIIALPSDDEEDENSYNVFLNEINNTSIIFITFVNIPLWSQEEKEKLITSFTMDETLSVNEAAKMKITQAIDKSGIRLFHTLDHNDFVMICNGEKTNLKDYLKTLEKIRFLRFADEYFVVHDITTFYGYKSKSVSESDISNSFSAVVSISGQDVLPFDISSSFKMETVGRYDHLTGYNNLTWNQLSEISKKLHKDNVITSRVHIGCKTTNEECGEYFPIQKPSPLFNRFDKIYKAELNSLDYDKLVEIYNGDEKYVDSIKLMLNEIGLAINITLQRGFSKYNSVCYIEPYRYFIKYIKDKIIGKFCIEYNKNICPEDEGPLSEILVDISNSFYKSILTLDSSIMHSERRFIISDPHQLTLFDVPPKLIAYYTAIANEMASALNKDSQNKYVFLITPDIKKDIYVESITDNRDIGEEINILVIHINERSIYNVTDTTKILAHEIAHHVGQDNGLRKKRACHFVRCYIALLTTKCLDSEIFDAYSNINDVVLIIEKIVEDIFKLLENSKLFNDINQYYYLDKLQDNIYISLTEYVKNIEKIDKRLYEILLMHLDDAIITNYIKKEESFFVDISSSLSNNAILKNYVYRRILDTAYENLQTYLSKPEGIECAQFVFKEGYADVQMILLTEDPNLEATKIIENYTNFEYVTDKVDEMMRKCAVINAFQNDMSDIAGLSLIQNHDILDQAYYVYVCKQATLYFTAVKNTSEFNNQESEYNKFFDYSKTSLFKNIETSKIIRQVDNTIASYMESILN